MRKHTCMCEMLADCICMFICTRVRSHVIFCTHTHTQTRANTRVFYKNCTWPVSVFTHVYKITHIHTCAGFSKPAKRGSLLAATSNTSATNTAPKPKIRPFDTSRCFQTQTSTQTQYEHDPPTLTASETENGDRKKATSRPDEDTEMKAKSDGKGLSQDMAPKMRVFDESTPCEFYNISLHAYIYTYLYTYARL